MTSLQQGHTRKILSIKKQSRKTQVMSKLFCLHGKNIRIKDQNKNINFHSFVTAILFWLVTSEF